MCTLCHFFKKCNYVYLICWLIHCYLFQVLYMTVCCIALIWNWCLLGYIKIDSSPFYYAHQNILRSMIKLAFMFYVFRRATRPALFLKLKNAPCLFSEMKNKPCHFSTISRARKPDSCQISKTVTWKVCIRKNSCTQKQQILRQNTILFLHGETFNKRGE